MIKNRFHLGVMPTILFIIFIATACVAINFACQPASDERRAALLDLAQPHTTTAAWAEHRLNAQPRLSNGAAVRLRHEIKSRLKENGIEAAAPAVAARPVRVSATADVDAVDTASATPDGLRATALERDDHPASEPWRIALGTLAGIAAIASILWVGIKRRG